MSNNKKQTNKIVSNSKVQIKNAPATQPEKGFASEYDFAFSKINYVLLGIGILLLGLGYILLSGGGSDDPNVFNEAMFDKRRLVVAPIIIVLGLVVEIVAIMYRSKNDEKKEQ